MLFILTAILKTVIDGVSSVDAGRAEERKSEPRRHFIFKM